MGKKPRSDSKLDSLTAGQKSALKEKLLANVKYVDILVWLEEDCSVSSSLAAVSAFYTRHCKPVIKERRQLLALKAETIMEGADESQFDMAAIHKLREMAFEMMLTGDADVKDMEKVIKLVLKAQAQDHDARKLQLLEKKAIFADEVKKKAENTDGGVTAEDMAEIERQLKMM